VFKQANGDIIITVEHKPHPLYTVASNGIDLVHVTTVSLVDAILGYRYRVPRKEGLRLVCFSCSLLTPALSKNLTLLDGSVLQVEHSTIAFSGASINYLFKGLPDVQNPDTRGSLSVQFKVQFPR
jgi:DnaJ-class molecular chaperone